MIFFRLLLILHTVYFQKARKDMYMYVYKTLTYICLFYIYNVQYRRRHIVINHCDRRITLLNDTDIFCVLFNLLTYFWMIPSNTLLVIEKKFWRCTCMSETEVRTKDISTLPRWVIRLITRILSRYVSNCTVHAYMYFQTRFSVGISILKKAVKMVTFVSP